MNYTGNIVKVSTGKSKGHKWTITSDKNAQTVGTSHQTFSRKSHAVEMVDKILKVSVIEAVKKMLETAYREEEWSQVSQAIKMLDECQDKLEVK